MRGASAKFHIAAGLVLAAAISGDSMAAVMPAEQVLLHGKVFTASDARPWAQAVAITGGMIVGVGSDSEIEALAGPATQVVDLHGRMLMPGLIDSHAHPIAGGRQARLASADGKPLELKAFKELVDRAIADGSALHGDRVIVVGIHPSLWSLDLDSVFNRPPYVVRPILFAGEDAHTAWANHTMLAVLGVTASSVAAMPPAKRQYFAVDAKGVPTGFASEAGASQLFSALPGRDGTYDPKWGRQAVRYYNEHGVTAVLEANAGHPSEDGETVLHVYKALSEQGLLSLHVSALLQAETVADLPKIYELGKKYAGLHNFGIVGVKMFADGILEYPAQTAATSRPYRNSGKNGVLKIEPTEMNAIAVDADRHGMIVHIHAIGDRAVHEALDAIAAARKADPGTRLPHTLAHLQLIDPADVPRFAQLNAIASFQLLWASADEGETKLVKPYIDPASYAFQYPARSVHASGGVVAGGSDWPVTSGDPWEAMAQAMTRQGPYGVLNESERLPLSVLLRAYTINAAKALCLDSQIGSIESGKEADLTLLDRDITNLSARDVAAVRPVWTMVHGALVYQRPADHYKVAGKIAGRDGGWDYATYNAATGRLYVSRTDGVMAVDVAHKVVTPQLIAGSKARSVVMLPGGRALVTFESSSEAVLFDAQDGRRLASLSMPRTPDGAVFEPRSGRVYVMSKSGQITIVDPSVPGVIGQIDVGGELETAAVDGNGRLYVNVADTAQVAVVDLSARRVNKRYPLKGCEGPTGLAYATELDVLVAACDNGVAKILNAASGADLGTVKIGGGADAVLYDASRALALIPSGDDASLAVIKLTREGGRIVERVATGRAAATGALDPTSGRVYLPFAEFSGTGPPEKRSAHVPGTFAVLVVSP